MDLGMTYQKTDMNYLQIEKSYEGTKLKFSNDHQAAILTGSEFFLHDVVELLIMYMYV